MLTMDVLFLCTADEAAIDPSQLDRAPELRGLQPPAIRSACRDDMPQHEHLTAVRKYVALYVQVSNRLGIYAWFFPACYCCDAVLLPCLFVRWCQPSNVRAVSCVSR